MPLEDIPSVWMRLNAYRSFCVASFVRRSHNFRTLSIIRGQKEQSEASIEIDSHPSHPQTERSVVSRFLLSRLPSLKYLPIDHRPAFPK